LLLRAVVELVVTTAVVPASLAVAAAPAVMEMSTEHLPEIADSVSEVAVPTTAGGDWWDQLALVELAMEAVQVVPQVHQEAEAAELQVLLMSPAAAAAAAILVAAAAALR
jgi:hypothetical protein